MIFTKEQFDHIFGDYGLPLDDLPFALCREDELRLFNSLPEGLQGSFLSWGTDTKTKDELFTLLIRNQFDCDPREYYKNEYYREPQTFNWEKLNNL